MRSTGESINIGQHRYGTELRTQWGYVSMVTAYQIVRTALNTGELVFTGGCYPSRTVISYDGGVRVTLEGRTFLVKGFKCGGRWDERIWCDGPNGGIAIYEGNDIIHKDNNIPSRISMKVL